MQGCLACRPEAAIDGDLATAWQTPFVGVRDQWVDYELPAPITFDRMDLSVVADGRHSVPTRIRLEVGDDVRVLTLPPIGDAATENATATVPLTFPAVTGRTVRVTIEDVREVNTFSYFSNNLALTPAAIAELGIPGLAATAPATSLGGECRDDLLFVDGDPVPIRITGTAADGLANAPLAVETCDPADPSRAPSLTLDAGSHEVEAALGVETALQLDRLVLASAAGGGPGTVEGGRVAPRADRLRRRRRSKWCATAAPACASTSTAPPNRSGSSSVSPRTPVGARPQTAPHSDHAASSTATPTAGSSIRRPTSPSTSFSSGRPSAASGPVWPCRLRRCSAAWRSSR